MALLFRNWLEEGYYEEDDYGDLTKIDDPTRIIESAKNGTLYENDGMAMTKVHNPEEIFNKFNLKT